MDKTASAFPKLNAAALGAQQMANWASQRNIPFTLLTDQGGNKVRHADVYEAVDKFVKDGVYDQLILYFSGHGVLMAPDCEAWLLSGAPDNPNEAINVAGSIANARTCGIEHIVVYSDACRSIPTQWRSAMLTPGTVFPVLQPRDPSPEVDAFYATLPGNPAFEVPPDQASKAHRGLLTDCLIKALDGQIADVIVDQKTHRVVPARPLKLYLTKAIPAEAAKVSIKLLQNPDARVESALPKYLSELGRRLGEPAAPPSKNLAVTDLPLGLKRTIYEMQERLLAPGWRSRTVSLTQIADPENVAASIIRILDAKGRISFETRTGFTIRGADVKSALITGTTCDVFLEDGTAQVRVHEKYEDMNHASRTAFIRFSDGSGVVLAVLPGYVGTVVVEEDQVVTVNYTPARGTKNYFEYEHVADQLEQRRAFVAVAARNGTFRLDRAKQAADYLRVLKKVDPTLGIYAAYAYAQVGNLAGIRSVFRYMSYEPEPVPFDVAMLALQYDEQPDLNYTPGLPMLTQGWMSLGRLEPLMPKPLKAARRYLKPSLWTTFTKEGMNILEGELTGGE
ncbi:MAG: caspase family protein [Aquabacterium sp.]|uniref:caspase family protein n=1 Tax=Aquabacterium sp. TaxID=1872578 RepID=UPI00271945D5|nr:caspase family protein [Aquabacterium sp.]MDO9004651.1 caspase family protein [Aquabacterium sp.]